MVYCLAAALGLELSTVTCISFVAFLTMLPISLHGIGVRDGAFVLLLAPFGIAGLLVAQEAAALRPGAWRDRLRPYRARLGP